MWLTLNHQKSNSLTLGRNHIVVQDGDGTLIDPPPPLGFNRVSKRFHNYLKASGVLYRLKYALSGAASPPRRRF